MSGSQPELESVSASLGALLRSAAEAAHEEHGASSRARLLERASVEEGHSSALGAWGRAWRVGGTALVASLVAAAWLVWRSRPLALTYEVVGAKKDGAYVSAPGDHEVSVRFSDATELAVASGSQLRVEDMSARGARVLLERGVTTVHVVHRDGARWTFAAGPFDVLVTGTRFTLAWDPATEVLDLRLADGSVDIQTPFGAAPLPLHAGQEVRADVRHRSMTTTDADGGDGAVAGATPSATSAAPLTERDAGAPQDDPDARPEPPEPPDGPASRGAIGPPRGHVKDARSWSSLVAAGQFQAVLDQADGRGADACVRSCSAADLSALADAARYSGRSDLAEHALRALVARFGDEGEGRRAMFLLGRLREQQGAAGEARGWYERYRSHAPSGAYAAEALGGVLRTTARIDGRTAAAPVAREYLQRYPAGADAATARTVLGQP